MSKENAHFNVMLGLTLRARLEREAERRDRSLADIVREALDAYLPDEED
jgi:predicted DNA-binding protein